MCERLVIDATDPAITFDADGVCNYWHEYQQFRASLPNAEAREAQLKSVVAAVQKEGRRRPYDCVLGLSGGVDSSYLALLAAKLGLRPLVVHFDNGWNNELAVANIERITRHLGLHLETFVMDWPEFRDLQRAYFKASVLDLEVPTDHMIFGALYEVAVRHNIRVILSGNNYRTEWLLPAAWYYSKFDLENLRAIHRKHGERKLKHLPKLGVWQHAYYKVRHRMVDVKLLDLVDYKKAEAKRALLELGWRDYGGKHYESLFTRFYQGYILPRKFNVDKRKAHLSNLILSEQITRAEALAELAKPPYEPEQQEKDKTYVARKLGFTESEFEAVLSLPNREHAEFGTHAGEAARLARLMGTIRPVTRFVKRLGWRAALE